MVAPLKDRANRLFPGIAIAGLVAIAAQFLNEHYGAPAMLMALLLGMPLNFLSEEQRTGEGIAFAARTLLRVGVALLGVRISVEMVQQLGLPFLLLVILGVLVTIGFSLLIGGLFGRDRLFSFLTGGAVAICGASAAMAIGSILPKREHAERDLAFTVITVTVLSTLAMIFYPILTSSLGLSMDATGVFLGGTIHDVAQVVGAGFSISEETGDLSTLVKLIRVTMLAPIVLVAALILRGDVHRWREELIQAGQCFDQARLLCAGHESVLLATVEVQHGLACLAGRNDEEAVRHFDRADAAAQRPQADRLLLARLPMATHGSDRAFDRALDQVRRALDRHPDDPDHAFCLEVAADRARKARRKQILWAMAAEVWRSLGRPRRASLAERALATLARS